MKTQPRLWLGFAAGVLLLFGAVLAGCAPDTSAPERQVPTESTPVAPAESVPQDTPQVTQASAVSVTFTDDACLTCHTNEQVLRAMAVVDETAPGVATDAGAAEPMREAWQRLYIDAEAYASDVHRLINCTACHGGQAVGSMEAHEGLIVDPSEDPVAGCGSCHPNIAPFAAESLHFTLRGFDTALQARSSEEHFPALDEMQAEQCSSCHASCGDCHVSAPQIAGGGLLSGHQFLASPPAEETCTACHGARVGSEFEGLNEGLPPDVHFAQAGMACTDCHSGEQMHGMGEFADKAHRYDGEPAPACIDCHQDDVGIGSGNLQHELHGTEIVSCQVCHSVAYPTCSTCHVEPLDEGVPFQPAEAHEMAFLIGRNPLISNDRPWRYVPVQHAPVTEDSFAAYGEDLLSNFLNRPTWSYGTPHNIQRQTPQNASCVSCHGNEEIFLTADKVAEAERGGANARVVVDRVPPFPDYAANLIRQATERINAALGLGPAQFPQPVPTVEAETPAPTEIPTEAPTMTPETAPATDLPAEVVPTATAEPTIAPEPTTTAEPVDEAGDSGDFSWWANH